MYMYCVTAADRDALELVDIWYILLPVVRSWAPAIPLPLSPLEHAFPLATAIRSNIRRAAAWTGRR